jgi:hypothetical protein
VCRAAAIVTFNRRDFGRGVRPVRHQRADTRQGDPGSGHEEQKYLTAPASPFGQGGDRAAREGRRHQHQSVRGDGRGRKTCGDEHGRVLCRTERARRHESVRPADAPPGRRAAAARRHDRLSRIAARAGLSPTCLRLNTGHHEDMIEEYPLRRIEKGRASARAALNSPAVSLPERWNLTYVYDFICSFCTKLGFCP